MGLQYQNLDAATRQFMVEEIDTDTADSKLYFSSYLSERGVADWPALLKQAAESYDDDWFGRQLQQSGRLNRTAQRRKPKGGFTTVRVPVTAHQTLAEGEFNRFYIRGLCKRAIGEGIGTVEIYRAKSVDHPRPESEAKIGTIIDPDALLADLRQHVGVETSSGFPGPNSGLSVRLP